MPMLFSLQQSMDSWSRTDPPGCTMAVMPASWASSTQSLKGQYDVQVKMNKQVKAKRQELAGLKQKMEELSV